MVDTERFEQVPCLMCGEVETTPFLVVPDRFVPENRYQLVHCARCGFVYLNPRPRIEQMNRFYEHEEYQPHQLREESLFDRIYAAVRTWNIRYKRYWIERFIPKGRILDFGCGTGEFLLHMKNHGWKAVGLEPETVARDYARNLGLDVVSNLGEIRGSFDCISLWHVLEHIHDVPGVLRFLRSRLNPGGVIVLALPNRLCWDARAFREFWVAYDAPRHLYHFVPQEIKQLLASYGLTIVYYKGLYVDTIYNVLLSAALKKRVKKDWSFMQKIATLSAVSLFSIAKEVFQPLLSSSFLYVAMTRDKNKRENRGGDHGRNEQE